MRSWRDVVALVVAICGLAGSLAYIALYPPPEAPHGPVWPDAAGSNIYPACENFPNLHCVDAKEFERTGRLIFHGAAD